MGHQDKTGKELNHWKMLNEEMDTKAKDYWLQTYENRPILLLQTKKSMWVFKLYNDCM